MFSPIWGMSKTKTKKHNIITNLSPSFSEKISGIPYWSQCWMSTKRLGREGRDMILLFLKVGDSMKFAQIN